MKKYIPLFLIFLLVFLLSVSFFWLYSARLFISRATVPQAVSGPNSYAFGSPTQAAADGKAKIRINIFLLNDRGLGTSGQVVHISGVDGAILTPVQPLTDNSGKAVYDLSSNRAGEFHLTFSSSGVTLPQVLSIMFK